MPPVAVDTLGEHSALHVLEELAGVGGALVRLWHELDRHVPARAACERLLAAAAPPQA